MFQMAENKIVMYCGRYSKRRFVMFRKVGAIGELKNEKGKDVIPKGENKLCSSCEYCVIILIVCVSSVNPLCILCVCQQEIR